MKNFKTVKNLESLEKFQIKKDARKNVFAGSVGMPYGGLGTCVCTGGGCQVVIGEHGPSYTGGNWRTD